MCTKTELKYFNKLNPGANEVCYCCFVFYFLKNIVGIKFDTLMWSITPVLTFFLHYLNALNEGEFVRITNLTLDFLACLFLLDVQQPERNIRNEAEAYFSLL